MKKTSTYLRDKKARKQPISMLTRYDYPTAQWEEEAGIVDDVAGGRFPGAENVRHMPKDAADSLRRQLG